MHRAVIYIPAGSSAISGTASANHQPAFLSGLAALRSPWLRRNKGAWAVSIMPFMKLADIGLFARSAASDARIRSAWTSGSAADVFDSLYANAPENDPWASASPAFLYQRRKYETIAALIPPTRYRRALDLGCGTGLFTERLAAIADEAVGVDVSSIAVRIAIGRN